MNNVVSASLVEKSPDSHLNQLSARAACRRLIASGLSIRTASAISRQLMVASLSVGAVATFSPSAVADTTNTIRLSGTVQQVLDVSAKELTIEVPLDYSAISNLNVGSVTVRSNASNGYKLTVTSANNGVLKKTDSSNSSSTPYTLSYDGAAAVSLSGTAETPLVVENKTSTNTDLKACATSAGCSRSLTINVKESDANNRPAGLYRDTLMFNIIAN
ncbi:hypothetical protein Cri9333_1517 [Crinalium epipsammum PCC 9333]|uniref:Uncharacterized protein n=1 Tax=Crinalium epipsammum PCC 9333 TaxID=1173022 RepID=K9VXY6_9CYAN|nr:hypothetical protein [Crinalium epipsammum]AFZ12409.1 hypothetical protein Cri9333_1517 [Crinalium epipsammum PCC 9333]